MAWEKRQNFEIHAEGSGQADKRWPTGARSPSAVRDTRVTAALTQIYGHGRAISSYCPGARRENT